MAIPKSFLNLRKITSVQNSISPLSKSVRSLSSLKNPSPNNERVTYKLPVKEDLKERKSLLSVFNTDYNLALNMSSVLNSIDLSPKGLKKILDERQERVLALSQQYIPLRAETLGSDLAAAHFVVHRGGKVKFLGQEEWIQLDKNSDESSLPRFYDASFLTEALDCSQMTLTHQGLLNMSKLNDFLHIIMLLKSIFHRISQKSPVAELRKLSTHR